MLRVAKYNPASTTSSPSILTEPSTWTPPAELAVIPPSSVSASSATICSLMPRADSTSPKIDDSSPASAEPSETDRSMPLL